MDGMLELEIPGWGEAAIENLVLDYNGTIALDGELLPGAAERIERIAAQGIQVFVITADTNGTVKAQCAGLPLEVLVHGGGAVAKEKLRLVERLGRESTMAIGNGNNDREMLEGAGISVAVLGKEGCSAKTLAVADILVPSIEDGLDLLLKPHRLKATLRG